MENVAKWTLAIAAITMLGTWLGVKEFHDLFFKRDGTERPVTSVPGPASAPAETSKRPTDSVVDLHEKKVGLGKLDENNERIRANYDALVERYSAIRSSLEQRAISLGNQPIKPEIISAIKTTESDLKRAHEAILKGEFQNAHVRMERAETTLKVLESL